MVLVFVYLGDSLPKYVLANMRQVSLNHPNIRLVFIGDSEFVCKKVASNGYEVWKSPNPEEFWDINRNSLSHNPDFRDGFWFKTLARFFALSEFLRNNQGNSSMLIESDVWISPRFPFDQFENFDFGYAYPLTTLTQGVASTFFVKSEKEMKFFLDFAKDRVMDNSNSTDVTILADFRAAHPNKVYILPSGPTDKSGYNESFQVHEPKIMSDGSIFSNQFFDASTWGQFLTGEDPRNSWGFRFLYHPQTHHAVNPSKFSFSVEDNEIFAHYFNAEYRINSLHVHSKDIRIFQDEKFLGSRITRFQGKEIHEIVWLYFLKFIPFRIVHEIKRLLRKNRRSR